MTTQLPTITDIHEMNRKAWKEVYPPYAIKEERMQQADSPSTERGLHFIMKKIVALLAVAALVAFAAPALAANPFMDVPMDSWAYDAAAQALFHENVSPRI